MRDLYALYLLITPFVGPMSRKERSEDDEHQSALVIHGSNQVLALLRLLLDWQKPSALTRSLFASPYIVTNFPFPQARFSLPKVRGVQRCQVVSGSHILSSSPPAILDQGTIRQRGLEGRRRGRRRREGTCGF